MPIKFQTVSTAGGTPKMSRGQIFRPLIPIGFQSFSFAHNFSPSAHNHTRSLALGLPWRMDMRMNPNRMNPSAANPAVPRSCEPGTIANLPGRPVRLLRPTAISAQISAIQAPFKAALAPFRDHHFRPILRWKPPVINDLQPSKPEFGRDPPPRWGAICARAV